MYILKKKPKKHNRNKLGELLRKKNKRSREGDVGASLSVSKVAWGGGMDSK